MIDGGVWKSRKRMTERDSGNGIKSCVHMLHALALRVWFGNCSVEHYEASVRELDYCEYVKD